MFDFSGRSLEDATRITTMRAAWDAYRGVFPQPLQNRPRKQSDAVTVNRCKPIVEKAVSALFGKDMEFQVATEGAEDAQDWLDACFRANKKMAFLQKLGINASVCGHVFVKIVAGSPYPRLVVLDPTTVTVTFQPDDIDNVTAYQIEYTAENGRGERTQFRQYISQSGNQWEVLDQEMTGKQWVTKAVTTWPYPFSPIVECQNLPNPNSFWGTPDLTEDVINANKSLNFVYSNVARIIRYHAHPKTWVKGLSGNKLSVGPDETIVLPDKDSEMGSLEMHSDLSSSLTFARRLETAMDVMSRTPSLALGDLQDVPRGQVTGPALNLMLEPLIEKTESKRRLIGGMLEDLCRRLLIIGGYPEDTAVFIHWPEIIPTDPVSEAQVAQIYLSMGVSKSTVFSRLNLDYEQEREKLAREALPVPTVTETPITPTTQESAADPDEVTDPYSVIP
jgi:hypothetical protein